MTTSPTGCDPVGDWDLLYKDLGACGMFKRDDALTVALDGGKLCFDVLRYDVNDVQVDSTGCQFTIAASASSSNPSETYSEVLSLALTFVGDDESMGQLDYTLSGGSNCSVAQAAVFGRRHGGPGSTCDPYDTATCPGDFGCYAISGQDASCRPAGDLQDGEQCNRSDECLAGSLCSAGFSCGAGLFCRPVCALGEAGNCGPAETCTETGGFAACIPDSCL